MGEKFINTVLISDREKVQTALEIGLKDRKKFSVEFQQSTKNNQLIWCESRGAPVFDEHGDLLHVIITTRNITEQKEYKEKLEQLALHDPLTGLANRRLLRKHMTYALKVLKETDDGIAVIMLDIDNFKEVNDNYGHATGDEVLKEYCKRISESIRPKDTVARFGGDEFIVLLPNTPNIEDALKIAKKIRKVINAPWNLKGNSLKVTTSMGITLASSSETDSQTLLKEADKALYKAKELGKNNYVVSEEYEIISPIDIEKPV